MCAWFGLPEGGGAAARPCPQFLSRPPAHTASLNTSAATTIQINAGMGGSDGRGVFAHRRPLGSEAQGVTVLKSKALLRPSGEKPLDTRQHDLALVGFVRIGPSSQSSNQSSNNQDAVSRPNGRANRSPTAEFLKRLKEGRDPSHRFGVVGGIWHNDGDPPHPLRLLRTRPNRPRERCCSLTKVSKRFVS